MPEEPVREWKTYTVHCDMSALAEKVDILDIQDSATWTIKSEAKA